MKYCCCLGLGVHGGFGSGGLGPSVGTGLGTGFGATGLGGAGSGLPLPTRGTPSLGMLGSQALAQQAPAMRGCLAVVVRSLILALV